MEPNKNSKPVRAVAFMASEYDCGNHWFGIPSGCITVIYDDGSELAWSAVGMVYGTTRGKAKFNFWAEYKEWSKSYYGRSLYLSPKVRANGTCVASF